MYKTFAKTLLMSATLMAASLAQAQLTSVNTTFATNGPYKSFQGFVLGSSVQGSGELAFSKSLIGALGVAGITTSINAPAAGSVTSASIRISAPIMSVSGYFSATAPASQGGTATFTATNVATMGGATMTAAEANFATNGGQLTVGGIGVDLATQGIYADISGANGLVSQRVRVWDYANIEGATTLSAVAGTTVAENKLTGLTITKQAFDLFAQGLGLEPGGIAAMGSIKDYGVMTSVLNFDGPPLTPIGNFEEIALVPEPSTYLMMGLGLVGMVLAARRRQSLA